MKNKRNHLLIQLDGGIGNQLFQISSGIYHGDKLKKEPIFKIPLNEYEQNHKSWLINALSGEYKIYSNKLLKLKFNRYLWRIDRKLIKQIKYYSLFRRVSDFQNESDSNLINISNQTKEIRGYFQSSTFPIYSKNVILKILDKVQVSSSAKQLMNQVELDAPIGVHIRRGDYLKFEDLYGLLAIEYYEVIFEEILNITPNQKFWIFSNDIENVEKSFSHSKHLPQLYFVDLKKELTDLESFILLSKCAGHITGNSTYSWWAAFIADNSKFVYCPDPWNKNIFYSDKLIPLNWIKQKSIWVN